MSLVSSLNLVQAIVSPVGSTSLASKRTVVKNARSAGARASRSLPGAQFSHKIAESRASFFGETLSVKDSLSLPPRTARFGLACHGNVTRVSAAVAKATKVDLATANPKDVRVLLVGGTGYIGRYVAFELIKRGYNTTIVSRSRSGVGGKKTEDDVRKEFEGAEVVFGDVCDKESLQQSAFKDGRSYNVVVNCLASRTGGKRDSWKIDYQASLDVQEAARAAGCQHIVLLSAICVQKPLLEFQRAKLKYEAALTSAGDLTYSIVRPTAFFKSLGGQVARVKNGSSYIMFGDGKLCKCNAISEADLAEFIVNCVSQPDKRNAILPIGGPGSPVTPLEQAGILFKMFNREPKYTSVPIQVMDVAIGAIDFVGNLLKNEGIQDAAEFARIGRYYATEDMVGPSYGKDTLEDFFKQVSEKGMAGQELGDAAVFK
eukprot:jgi/Mesvir1/20842/Mv07935-RA.1